MVTPTAHTQALGPTGLNLIRIAISGYFIAVALDWAEGVNKGVLFFTLGSPATAQFIGSMLLFYLAFVYLCGFQLRMSALFLALFVLASAFVDVFVYHDGQNLGSSGLWRDLAFVCAILLSYASLSRRDMSRVSAIRQKIQARSVARNKLIQPNRVAPRSADPLTLPTIRTPAQTTVQTTAPKPAPSARPRHTETSVTPDDTANIFADV